VSTNADLINYLLVNTLSYDDKIFVKKLPVPQPSMVDLIQSKSGHNPAFSKTLPEKYMVNGQPSALALVSFTM
jgi:hypothetical protein